MLRKKPVKGSDKVSVTFEAPGLADAGSVSVVGEFNSWDPASTKMKKRKDGAWAATVRLERGRRYQYRFVVDERTWVADDEADEQVPNPFGGVNSVVRLSEDDG